MDLISRAKNIVLGPKAEWEVVANEQTSVKAIYLEYLVVLAAIPAVAGFIGMSLIGFSMFGVTVRTPFVAGIVQMVLSYAMSLAMVFVIGLIIDALAPSFKAEKNPLNAFKLAAFSMTPSMLAGVLHIIPALAPLAILASLYGIYVLYLGVPVLMKAPQDKSLPYTAVIIVCAIVLGFIIGAVTAAVGGAGAMAGARMGAASPEVTTPASVSFTTPDGKIEVNTQKLEAMNQKLEELNKQMDAAQKSGDTAAATQAALQALGTVAGAVTAQSAAQ